MRQARSYIETTNMGSNGSLRSNQNGRETKSELGSTSTMTVHLAEHQPSDKQLSQTSKRFKIRNIIARIVSSHSGSNASLLSRQSRCPSRRRRKLSKSLPRSTSKVWSLSQRSSLSNIHPADGGVSFNLYSSRSSLDSQFTNEPDHNKLHDAVRDILKKDFKVFKDSAGSKPRLDQQQRRDSLKHKLDALHDDILQILESKSKAEDVQNCSALQPKIASGRELSELEPESPLVVITDQAPSNEVITDVVTSLLEQQPNKLVAVASSDPSCETAYIGLIQPQETYSADAAVYNIVPSGGTDSNAPGEPSSDVQTLSTIEEQPELGYQPDSSESDSLLAPLNQREPQRISSKDERKEL